MKMNNGTMLALLAVAGFTLAGSTQAQFAAGNDDGIAASPKVRASLEERKTALKVAPSPSMAVSYQASGAPEKLAASPKTRQMLAERKAAPTADSGSSVVVSYAARIANGVAASPKLLEQLSERPAPVQIAPVK